MTRLLKSGQLSEDSIQIAVMEWVGLNKTIAPFVIHIPNEGKRTPCYGKRLSRMGMRKGVVDIFIAIARRGFHGAWLELKSKNGRLSVSQTVFLNNMAAQGYCTKVAYTIEEAIQFIQWYCQ